MVDGINFGGVVSITDTNGVDTFGCTGSLLTDGYSILTAAHCVTTAYGQPNYTNITVNFPGPNGVVSATVSNVQVDSGYTGNSTQGSDLAVLTLSQQAPSFAVEYSLFSDPSDPDMVPTTPVILAGYGYEGNGLTGAEAGTFGTLQEGTNEYVENGSTFDDSYSSQLLIGQFYDASKWSTNALNAGDPYSSSNEVDIAPGDSGGPTFYDGEIIGVHNLGICYENTQTGNCSTPPSLGSSNDSYFGEMFADTSVAQNLAFIEDAEVPEPCTLAMLAAGFTILGLFAYRRRREPRPGMSDRG